MKNKDNTEDQYEFNNLDDQDKAAIDLLKQWSDEDETEIIDTPLPDNGNRDSDAALKLVTTIADTPENKMSELTNIPKSMAFRLPMMETFEKIADPYRTVPLRKIWRMSFYKHQRSVGAQHLIRLTMLAENEMTDEDEIDSWREQ